MSLKIDRAELEVVIKNDKARQKMMELEDKMRETQKTMTKLSRQRKKDSEEYKVQEGILKRLKQEYDDVTESIGINNLSVRELARRSKELNQILNKLDPNEPVYTKYKQQLKEVNERLKELKGTAKDTQLSFGKLADGFNRYAGLAAGAIASLTGVALTMRECVDAFAAMEEAEAQVIKYTGMTKEEVEKLNETFKRMDTRTSREALNGLAADAGRLGIQGAEDIKKFVEAGNMIRVALGEDLGEDAIKQMGKLAEIFNPDMELTKGMLSIGSAINEVAQNSSASERYLVDFTARLGGTGKQAKMAVTDIMGYASALDQNMIRSEMASTALQKLILSLYKEPTRFAELAGLEVQNFTELLKNDANEAVLTFLSALGRLGGMEALSPVLADMKLEGTEAASVIASLAANVEKIREEQVGATRAFEDGTSIMHEYSVQNTTVQAELDKAKKHFKEVRVELGQKLQPAMKYMISTGSLTVKMLSKVVTFFIKYGKALATAAIWIGTYTAAVKLNVASLKLQALWTTIATAKTKLATAATAAWNAVLAANPLNVLLATLGAFVSYMVLFKNKTDDATDAQKRFNAEIGKLSQDENDRIASIKARFNDINNLNKNQIVRLREDAKTEHDILADRIADQEALFREEYRQKIERMKKLNPKGVWKGMTMTYDKELAENMAKLDALRQQANELKRIMDGIPVEDEEKLAAEEAARRAKIEADNAAKEAAKTHKKNLDDRLKTIENKQKIETELLENQHALNLIDEETYQKRMYDINVRFLTQRISLLKEFGKKTSEEELQMLNLMTEESNRVYLNNLGKGSSDKKDGFSATSIIEEEDPEEDTYVLDKFKNSQDGKLAILEAFHEAGLISEEEYQDKITEMNRQKEEERAAIRTASLQTVADLAGSLSQLMGAMQDAEISKVSRKYDKQIKEAKKAGKDTTKLEEEKEAEIAAIKKKYADKQFAMAVLQITATTAITAMEAYKAMAGIPVVGPALGAAAAAAAVIAGAAQIAVAKQQRDEAKGLYSGGYSEGYTSSGNPHEVAGVIPVHKNEFVTNHEGVANPHVRQFLDVFDMAQKNGTIGMLNTTQILERVKYVGGKYDGGYSDDPQTTSLPSGDFSIILRQILDAVRNNSDYLSAISNKDLKIDVRAVRDGITQVERLERNARR